MLRRLACLLLVFALVFPSLPVGHATETYAQNGSPVPADPIPTEIPLPQETTEQPATEPVYPADVEGNTPVGQHTNPPLYPFPRTDVYIAIPMVTFAGQTDVIDGTNGDGPFAAEGYRSDNAKVLTIVTTASYDGNLNICVIFDDTVFANPAEIELFYFNGGSWTSVTNYLDANTVCGYSAVFGSFAVAEASTAPTVTATELPSATPTESLTPHSTSTETSTDTPLPTATETQTATPTASASASATPGETQLPTETATQSASATSTATLTASPSETATSTPSETASPSPTASATGTETSLSTATASATATPDPTETATASSTASATQTSTSAPSPIQFALPNVYVTYLQIPTSGTTTGLELSGSGLPALPATYLTSNAWFFAVGSTVEQSGNKRLCVIFQTGPYADPHRLVLLQRSGSNWSPISGQVLESLFPDQGTLCGYITAFGDFALVERAPATATATSSPSRTTIPTSTATPSATRTIIATGTPTQSATSTPSATGSSTGTASVSPSGTSTSTPTRTNTPTATVAPGSYATGTVLRATTGVNLRSGATTSSVSLGIVVSGTTVIVTGPSVSSGGLIWVPVTSSVGAGWIAGKYLALIPSPTVTRTPAPPTMTRTPGGSTPTRTATRPPGGFIAGDSVRTTANVNLRSGPGTSASILRVVPSQTVATVTGPGVVRSGITFYPVTISGYPSGYLAGSYLQRVTATATPSRTRTPTATVVGSTVRYTTDNVNLRTGPGTSYGIVATIPKGTRVNITGTPRRVSGTDWYPIIINGVGSGWMAGSFLTTLQPL